MGSRTRFVRPSRVRTGDLVVCYLGEKQAYSPIIERWREGRRWYVRLEAVWPGTKDGMLLIFDPGELVEVVVREKTS